MLLERLLGRAQTSGRDDDNIESIKKRFGLVPSATAFLCLTPPFSNLQERYYACPRTL